MNKLNPVSTSVTLSPVSHPEAAPWLIVLVPSFAADLSAATRRVWELANAGSGRVLFIGLYENAAQELTLRRQLAGMAAMVGSGGIYTETEIVFGSDWAEAVRMRSHSADMVACFANHRVGRLNRYLSNILQTNLDVPIYILSSSYLRKDALFNWQAQFLVWSVSIAIIFGFFLLQVRIDKLTSGWAEPTLVLTSVALELWMIWAWNSLFE